MIRLQLVLSVASGLLFHAPFSQGEESLARDVNAVERGRQVFNDRDKGHCLLCHALSSSRETFQGNLGPSLDGVTKRLGRAELRQRIADSRMFNPNTIMPPYYSTDKLSQVSPEYRDKTVLTEQELEDVVTYLIYEAND